MLLCVVFHNATQARFVTKQHHEGGPNSSSPRMVRYDAYGTTTSFTSSASAIPDDQQVATSFRVAFDSSSTTVTTNGGRHQRKNDIISFWSGTLTDVVERIIDNQITPTILVPQYV